MLQLSKNMYRKLSFYVSRQITGQRARVTMPMCLCLTLCFSFYAHAEGTGRIIKWKDDKGVTHYGDRIPPQYSNHENTLMNRQGITIQHNKPASSEEKTEDLAKQEQDKKDRVLLGAYTNADEIDLARDRNLQPDLIALDNLHQDKANSQKKLNEANWQASSYSKRNKSVPDDISTDIRGEKEKMARIDQLIAERQQTIATTRKRFDEDKKRYLLLKNQNNNATADMPNPSTRPAEKASGTTAR